MKKDEVNKLVQKIEKTSDYLQTKDNSLYIKIGNFTKRKIKEVTSSRPYAKTIILQCIRQK